MAEDDLDWGQPLLQLFEQAGGGCTLQRQDAPYHGRHAPLRRLESGGAFGLEDASLDARQQARLAFHCLASHCLDAHCGGGLLLL